MTVYLVTYDLNREINRPPIVDKIKNTGTSWARLSESSYAITHFGTPDDVYNALRPLLDQNDHIYIITLKQPWQGFGPTEVNEWLNKNLNY
ncbi:hypothetical protein [Paracandidimonas lactea]|uniref:hypothetical protein n=1 Tax=Paracandidimonas lactea TaxID=2895524 RepID=UPI001F19081F|nr:hypothetical protein [Paracandidimonas lactea]